MKWGNNRNIAVYIKDYTSGNLIVKKRKGRLVYQIINGEQSSIPCLQIFGEDQFLTQGIKIPGRDEEVGITEKGEKCFELVKLPSGNYAFPKKLKQKEVDSVEKELLPVIDMQWGTNVAIDIAKKHDVKTNLDKIIAPVTFFLIFAFGITVFILSWNNQQKIVDKIQGIGTAVCQCMFPETPPVG